MDRVFLVLAYFIIINNFIILIYGNKFYIFVVFSLLPVFTMRAYCYFSLLVFWINFFIFYQVFFILQCVDYKLYIFRLVIANRGFLGEHAAFFFFLSDVESRRDEEQVWIGYVDLVNALRVIFRLLFTVAAGEIFVFVFTLFPRVYY